MPGRRQDAKKSSKLQNWKSSPPYTNSLVYSRVYRFCITFLTLWSTSNSLYYPWLIRLPLLNSGRGAQLIYRHDKAAAVRTQVAIFRQFCILSPPTSSPAGATVGRRIPHYSKRPMAGGLIIPLKGSGVQKQMGTNLQKV